MRNPSKASGTPATTRVYDTMQICMDTPLQDIQKFILQDSELTLRPYQTRLLKEAMLGLEALTATERKALSVKERVTIETKHRRALDIINLWKQEIVSREVDKLLLSLFHRSRFIRDLVKKTKGFSNNTLKNTQSLTELGVSKQDLIRKLINRHVLPTDFLTLAA